MCTALLNGVPELVDDMAVTIKGKVYSFDVFYNYHGDSDEILGSHFGVYHFHPATCAWRVLLTELHLDGGSVNFIVHSVVTYDHCAYTYLESLTWHRVPTSGEAPAKRYYHTASAIGTRMYVWGVQVFNLEGNDQYDSSLYYLKTTTSMWVRPRVEGVHPTGRIHRCAFVYDEQLYIFGCYNGQRGAHFADMHRYDIEKSC
ncbi:kelch domain-containing protein 3-like [Amblyomma americanum]